MIFKREKKRKIYEMGPSGGDEKRARSEREDDFWPWKRVQASLWVGIFGLEIMYTCCYETF